MSADDRTGEIVLEHVSKSFGSVVAVDDVAFTIPGGSFFSMLGPSGCGKTTTLRMIAGFEEPDAGRVLLAGRRHHLGAAAPSGTSTWCSRPTACSRT